MVLLIKKRGSMLESKVNISRKNVGSMFDRIAPRYDLLNRLLSGRRDVAWRKKLATQIEKDKPLKVLDLATGTGDLLFTIMNARRNITQGIGMDISPQMLERGIQKLEKKNYFEKVIFQSGDAHKIPLESESVDVVTIAFGIRNVEDYEKGLKEIYRVLKIGGKVLVLEFSMPPEGLFRTLYTWYFRKILPKIGSFISGDKEAYLYLNKTVETFPYGQEFCKKLEDSSFRRVEATSLNFGIATIYKGEKHA